MKKFFRLFALAFAIILPVVSFAGCDFLYTPSNGTVHETEGEVSGNVTSLPGPFYANDTTGTWSYNVVDSTLFTVEITGYLASSTTCTIPSTIVSTGSVSYTVVSIAAKAFVYSNLDSVFITSMSLPATITTIGDYAFKGLDAMTTFTVASGSALTTIGYGAFSYCDHLTSITIPSSVTYIPVDCFYHCHRLASLTFAVDGDGNSSVAYIRDQAFAYCYALISVTLPNSCKKIGTKSFGYCKALTTFNINNGLEDIGDYAFIDSVKLATINIDNSTTIDGVNYPQTIEDIGVDIFSGCTSITYDDTTGGILYFDNWALALNSTGYSASTFTFIDGTIGVARDTMFLLPACLPNGTYIRITFPASTKYLSNYFFRMSGNLKSNTVGYGFDSLSTYITINDSNPYLKIFTLNSNSSQQHLAQQYQDNDGNYQVKFVMGTKASVWNKDSVFPDSYSYNGLTTYTIIGPYSTFGVWNFCAEDYTSKTITYYSYSTSNGSAYSTKTKTTGTALANARAIVVGSAIKEIGDHAFENKATNNSSLHGSSAFVTYIVIPNTVDKIGYDICDSNLYFNNMNVAPYFVMLGMVFNTHTEDAYNPNFPIASVRKTHNDTNYNYIRANVMFWNASVA